MRSARDRCGMAATHDIGFERGQRNSGMTHKIDPAIDGEREHVNGTLSGTGRVIQRDHVTPTDPLRTAKTATGGDCHANGRILVLVVKDTISKSNSPKDKSKSEIPANSPAGASGCAYNPSARVQRRRGNSL